MRQIKSLGSVKAVYLERDKLILTLREIARTLKKKYEWIKDVRLFGSLARGEERGLSDVDLLIITRTEVNKNNFWDLYGKVFDEVVEKLPISFDLVLVSEREFEKNKEKFGRSVKVEELT